MYLNNASLVNLQAIRVRSLTTPALLFCADQKVLLTVSQNDEGDKVFAVSVMIGNHKFPINMFLESSSVPNCRNQSEGMVCRYNGVKMKY